MTNNTWSKHLKSIFNGFTCQSHRNIFNKVTLCWSLFDWLTFSSPSSQSTYTQFSWQVLTFDWKICANYEETSLCFFLKSVELWFICCLFFFLSRSDIYGGWRKCTRTIYICDWCIRVIRWRWHRYNCRFSRVQYIICYWNVRNILKNITVTHMVATVSRLYILQCQFVSVDLFFSW